MFSKQFKTIFRVLGNTLLTLADMTEADADRLEMNGAQYLASIAKEDAPDVGKDTLIVTTNTAASVFGIPAEVANEIVANDTRGKMGGDVSAPVKLGLLNDPAPAQIVPGAPNGAPTYTMTASAGTYTREQYHAAGWTDEALIEHGHMIVTPPAVAVDNSPNVRTVDAPSTPSATSTQATESIPAVPQAAPAPTDAPVQAGGVTHDKTGLPWDARIHSGSRAQNNDGSWKKKKGVGETYVNQIVAELRQSTPAAAPTPFQPLTAPAAPAPAAPAPAAPAPAAPAPAAPAPAAPAPAASVTDFAGLCKWVTGAGLSMTQALEAAKPFGISAMGQLAQAENAHLIPLVHAELSK